MRDSKQPLRERRSHVVHEVQALIEMGYPKNELQITICEDSDAQKITRIEILHQGKVVRELFILDQLGKNELVKVKSTTWYKM